MPLRIISVFSHIPYRVVSSQEVTEPHGDTLMCLLPRCSICQSYFLKVTLKFHVSPIDQKLFWAAALSVANQSWYCVATRCCHSDGLFGFFTSTWMKGNPPGRLKDQNVSYWTRTQTQWTVWMGSSPEKEEGRTMIFHMRVFVHLSVTSQAEFKSCEWLLTISTVPAFVSCFSTNLQSRLAVPRFLFDGPTISVSSSGSAQPHIDVLWDDVGYFPSCFNIQQITLAFLACFLWGQFSSSRLEL